jgi:hypothetical protein
MAAVRQIDHEFLIAARFDLPSRICRNRPLAATGFNRYMSDCPRKGERDVCLVSDHRPGAEYLYLAHHRKSHILLAVCLQCRQHAKQLRGDGRRFSLQGHGTGNAAYLGGIDISPIILLLIIYFVRLFLLNTIYPMVA